MHVNMTMSTPVGDVSIGITNREMLYVISSNLSKGQCNLPCYKQRDFPSFKCFWNLNCAFPKITIS